MARLHTNIPADKRYSEEEANKIIENVYGIITPNLTKAELALLTCTETYSDGSYDLGEFIKAVQDEYTQGVIKYAMERGKLPLPISPTRLVDVDTYGTIKELDDVFKDMKNNLDKIKRLINFGVVSRSGNVNEKLDLDYINSIDLEKLDGYIRHKRIERAEKIEDFKRENELTPEQLHRKFTT